MERVQALTDISRSALLPKPVQIRPTVHN